MESSLSWRSLCSAPLRKAFTPLPPSSCQFITSRAASRNGVVMPVETGTQNGREYKLPGWVNGGPKTENVLETENQNNILPAPTLGSHLAARLVEIGVSDIFAVPGDSNLTLLDYFVAEKRLNLVGCCNEPNAGYAADGYARSRGVGACVVTFTVGGLSVINAIAGAYSADLPVICIVGGPNSNDYGTKKILHHTIGLPDFDQELRCFQTVTCHQFVINNLVDAQEQMDTAIEICLKESKPVYISISCDLVTIPHHRFSKEPTQLFFPPIMSNQMALQLAVEAAAELLNKAVKPVMVGGPKLRPAKAYDAFVELAEACGYALAIMPSAKGMVPENHPHFIGTYWGAVSSAYCSEVVEIADASIFGGPVFDDLSTCGYSDTFKKDKAIIVEPDRVLIPNMPVFPRVQMKDFFKALKTRLKRNTTAYRNYQRIYIPEGPPPPLDPKELSRVKVLSNKLQSVLSGDMAVIADAGDSWFLTQNMKLPRGCGYQGQVLYASIGWSVGATLGYAQAALHKRVITCIGDGSFQIAPQELSTMLRLGQKSIIFLLNNGGYSTEVQIHDGPYNVIKNWDYTAMVDAIDNGEGQCWTAKVTCEEELVGAIETAVRDRKDCLCFIEVIVHKDDTSKELLKLGPLLAAASGRGFNED